MMYFQTLVAVIFCTAVVHGRNLTVQNVGGTSLVVSVTGQDDITVLSGAAAVVTVSDDFSGVVSAVPVDAEVTTILTKAVFTLSDTSDSYAVSVIDGFNVASKIVAMKSSCWVSVCMANLLAACPTENQVTDSTDTVVACTNDATIFKKICPTALVSSEDEAITCTETPSYLILFAQTSA